MPANTTMLAKASRLTSSAPARNARDSPPQALIDKIEQADAYILASPTNMGSVTAIFKRFMERLAVYAFWPWEMNAPQMRKADSPRKKALLVSSCAAPGILGRLLYSTRKQLKMTAIRLMWIFLSLLPNSLSQILFLKLPIK